MKECAIKQSDYFGTGLWHLNFENASSYCNDPKLLHNELMPSLKAFQISSIKVKTFKSKTTNLDFKSKEISISPIIEKDHGKCYSLTFSKDILKHGIDEIIFKTEPNTKIALEIFLHQPGLLFTDEPSAYPMFQINSTFDTIIDVEHEIIQLLTYDNQPCNDSISYDLHDCREKWTHKVIFLPRLERLHTFKLTNVITN